MTKKHKKANARKDKKKTDRNTAKTQHKTAKKSRMGDNTHTDQKDRLGDPKTIKKAGLPQVMTESQALVPGRVTGKVQKAKFKNTQYTIPKRDSKKSTTMIVF